MEQAIITWIHLVAAAIWVGGSLFIGIVFSPLLKTMTSSIQERMQIMIRVGRRFNKVAVPSLIILMVTGLYTSHVLLSKPDLLVSTSYGTFLIIKIVLVIALIITYAVHVRVIRKDVEEKIMSNQMPEPEIQKLVGMYGVTKWENTDIWKSSPESVSEITRTGELYDRKKDQFQLNNLANQEPDIAKELYQQLKLNHRDIPYYVDKNDMI